METALAKQQADWSSLMASAQQGDRDAYRRLLEDVSGFLRALAFRHRLDPHDADDTVQDVLLTLHRIRHTFDPSRPFGPWITAIAHRRIVDRLRLVSRARRRETALNRDHEKVVEHDLAAHETAADRSALLRAVAHLTARQRQAVSLLRLQEMSLKAAAAETGMSVGALKVANHRALFALRKSMFPTGKRRDSSSCAMGAAELKGQVAPHHLFVEVR